MVDINKISRKALTILKLKYKIPERGFIAGGALANLMWELVSGNKAIINDIDVFIMTDLIDEESEKEKLKVNYSLPPNLRPKSDKIYDFKELESVYHGRYDQIAHRVDKKNYYIIL